MPAHDKPVVRVVNGRPTVDPNPLEFRRSQPNVTIVWRLEDSPGFTFTVDGIRIDGEETATGLQPQDEIVEGRRTANGEQFVWRNKNSRPGTYKYTIRLEGPGGVIEQDPTIINGAEM